MTQQAWALFVDVSGTMTRVTGADEIPVPPIPNYSTRNVRRVGDGTTVINKDKNVLRQGEEFELVLVDDIGDPAYDALMAAALAANVAAGAQIDFEWRNSAAGDFVNPDRTYSAPVLVVKPTSQPSAAADEEAEDKTSFTCCINGPETVA